MTKGSLITGTTIRNGEEITFPFCSFTCWTVLAMPGDRRRDYVSCYEFDETCANCGVLIPAVAP